MKIELTIKTSYLPEWGAYEGLRELLQNGMDAETQFKAPLEVSYRKDTQTVVIENEGATLPHEALLFGHTTKDGNSNLIGKFGEGLKLGVLALVRAGHEVKIRSGSEVWVPSIVRSEKFDADVLAFDIATGRQEKSRVQVSVGGISEDTWKLFRSCFLFLDRKGYKNVTTSHGQILFDEKYKGKIFVKGIFVENEPSFQYGYNITSDVSLDRDRKMVSRLDMNWRLHYMWTQAVAQREDLISKYLGMVFEGATDVANGDSYDVSHLSDSVVNEAAAKFQEKHGDRAIPVSALSESKEMESLGRSGVIVNKTLRSVLERKFGTVESNKAKLATEATAFHSWGGLTEVEKASLEKALSLVNPVEPVAIEDIDVVTFRSANLLGIYKGGHVLLSKAILADQRKTLETLVHEVAHRFGSDGEHTHVANIERIWSGIVMNLQG